MKQRIFDRETQDFVDIILEHTHRDDPPEVTVTVQPDNSDHHNHFYRVRVTGSIMVAAAINAVRAKNLPALIDVLHLFRRNAEMIQREQGLAS